MSLKLLRILSGQDGATVTDYHYLESAKKHWQKAKAAGLTPH
jgi:hypothetical protein